LAASSDEAAVAAIEILQQIAQQRGRGDTGPLAALRVVQARDGERSIHLPISQNLSQAWVQLTGEPFRQHHALALASLRRGEPFALSGGGPTARLTLHLLLIEVARSEPQATILLLAPDAVTAALHRDELMRMNAAMGSTLSIVLLDAVQVPRSAFAARVLIATPELLHERLLRYHDRAWAQFWARLRCIALPDVHHFSGVAAAHLAGLLLRANRLVPAGTAPLLLATLAALDGAEYTLEALSGHSWRIIAVDDVPRPSVGFALWRAEDRLREAATLAMACERQGLRVHVCCSAMETPLLAPLLGTSSAISWAPVVQPAQIQVCAGYPTSTALIYDALESGAEAVVLVLANSPLERTLLRQASRDGAIFPVLDDPPAVWIAPPINAYIAARHLRCAAAERPLTAPEVADWHAEAIVERLEQNGQLERLPEFIPAWQPTREVESSPYDAFSLQAAAGDPVHLLDERGRRLGTLDSAALDRWGYPGATLPLLRSSWRVIERNDGADTLRLRADQSGRRSFPLRSTSITVRDTRAERTLRGRVVGWGRVLIEERIEGMRESTGGSASERSLAPPLEGSWTAPAVWISIPGELNPRNQLLGWSLVAALTVRAICTPGDCVPGYDAQLRRLFLVDAQPGGNGLAAWLYANIELVLPLAYDIALDSRSDSLFEPLARADMDWLLVLLGGDIAFAAATAQPRQPNSVPSIEPPRAREEAVKGHDERTRGDKRHSRRDTAAPARPQQAVLPAPQEPRAAPLPPPREPPPREPPPKEQVSVPTRAQQPSLLPPSRPLETPPATRAPATEPSQHKPGGSAGRANSTEAPAPEVPIADPKAMLNRLRNAREQRERRQPVARERIAKSIDESVVQRFTAGDKVRCPPFGDGVVRESRVEKGREILIVDFPEVEDMRIDTSSHHVRQIDDEDREVVEDDFPL
jgi:hypothetical protein